MMAAVVRRVLRSADRPAWRRRWGFVGTATVVVFGLFAAGAALAQDAESAPEQSVLMPLAERSLLLDVAVAGERLVAVGERGHVLVSVDAGASWQQKVVPTRATLTGVVFADDLRGWAVGHDSVILRTGDGGESWERVYWAPEDENPFLDVWFGDAETGYAVGAYGSFFVTDDGGMSWQFEPISEDDFHLNQIALAQSGRMYIAAEAGFIYRSDDGGASWQELPSPYDGSFFGVLPLADDAVLIFGLRGNLFRSEDAGETWTLLETGTVAMLNDGLRCADGTIVIGGLGGAILLSDDGGRSFSLHPQAGRQGIQSIVESEEGALVMVGDFGVKKMTLSDLREGRQGHD